MYSARSDPCGPGFPIRTSPDHSSVGSSPRLFAASYVLHRLLMPRHPPCALNNLPQILKMLASTVQFSTFGQALPRTAACPHQREVRRGEPRPGPRSPRPEGPDREGPGPKRRIDPSPQDPTACAGASSTADHVPLRHAGSTDDPRSIRSPCQRSTHEHAPAGHSPAAGSGAPVARDAEAP